MPFTVIVPKEYPLVILACVILAIQGFCYTFYVIKHRGKTFNKEFIDGKCKPMHEEGRKDNEKKLPVNVAGGGFPDGGDGRYSDKLSYRDWYLFNQAARAH